MTWKHKRKAQKLLSSGMVMELKNKHECRRRLWYALPVIILIAIVVVPCALLLGGHPANNDCEDAIELKLDGSIVHGTFKGAKSNPGGMGFAGSGDTEGPVVWYKFQGTGSNVEITNDSRGGASFAIYEGASCDSLVESSSKIPFGEGLYDDGGIPYYRKATVRTSPGGQYYIYLMTCWCNHCLERPTFTISAMEVASPENDICATAIELPLDGTKVQGSLIGASANGDAVLVTEWLERDGRGHPDNGLLGNKTAIMLRNTWSGTDENVFEYDKARPFSMALFQGNESSCETTLSLMNMEFDYSSDHYGGKENPIMSYADESYFIHFWDQLRLEPDSNGLDYYIYVVNLGNRWNQNEFELYAISLSYGISVSQREAQWYMQSHSDTCSHIRTCSIPFTYDFPLVFPINEKAVVINTNTNNNISHNSSLS